MKKLFLFIFSLFFLLPMQAQITITSADLGQVGDMIIITGDTLVDDFNPGLAGPNQSWTFTGYDYDLVDTFVYQTPAGLPGSNLFPQANLASVTTDSIFVFHGSDNSEFRTYGTYISLLGIPTILTYDPYFLDLKLPLSYQDNFTHQYKQKLFIPGTLFPPFDSVVTRSNAVLTLEVDAHGTLTTDADTYDVLRFKRTSVTKDTTSIYALGMVVQTIPSSDSTVNYNWYAKGSKAPIVSYTEGDNAVVFNLGAPVVSSTRLTAYPDALVSVNPNPADAYAQIMVENMPVQDLQLSLFSTTGQLLTTLNFRTGQPFILDLGDLSKGPYLLQIKTKEAQALIHSQQLIKR